MKPITLSIFISVFFTVIAGGYACADVTGPGCLDWVAKVVSVEGNAEVQRAGKEQWLAIVSGDTLCPGDIIRVHERSRAAIYLHNETILRLDERTMATFSGFEKPGTPLFELLKGAVHFFSRSPRSLKVITPFVNAAIKGTEFFIKVQPDQSLISIFEGEVMASNESGSLSLTRGQSAIALAGKAPLMRLEARPRDSVHWAVYYPPIVDDYLLGFQNSEETIWQDAILKSAQYFRKGDLANAFSSLQGFPEETDDPRFFTYRAGLLLSVGRVDAAQEDIRRTLERHPFDARALALQSIIALVNNDKNQALALANKAVEADPRCAAARIALSYALQARFELDNALSSALQATELSPDNSIA
ncbi:MAG: FecR domain-containing protein, partial [Desulfatirhabdiaceae bacterium]|nr:FecR domain-containing protein [Desulfatirhabdiaceae bacterium]